MTAFNVGDRWIYTTPSGREILHKVIATDVEPKYQHKPGKCVQLMGVDARIPDTITWPEDIVGESYWRPAEEHGWR